MGGVGRCAVGEEEREEADGDLHGEVVKRSFRCDPVLALVKWENRGAGPIHPGLERAGWLAACELASVGPNNQYPSTASTPRLLIQGSFLSGLV